MFHVNQGGEEPPCFYFALNSLGVLIDIGPEFQL